MKSQFSLSDLSLAIVMFAVTATMHEASRAERMSHSLASIAANLLELPELLWQLL